jgi:flagellar assembly protein FliH
MELSNNRDTIVSLIRNSLLGSMLSGEITVRVSPDDYEYVQKNRERLLDGIGNAELTIKKDSTLNKGGCIVETEYGTVDSSVETQLKAVEDIFKELLGKEPVEV